MYKKVTEFTVNREEWHRGQGPLGSSLLRSQDGMKCCLGFYCEAMGFNRSDIEDITMPSRIFHYRHSKYKKAEPFMYSLSSDTMNSICKEDEIAEINDAENLHNQVREEMLTKKFAECGITVKFVN